MPPAFCKPTPMSIGKTDICIIALHVLLVSTMLTYFIRFDDMRTYGIFKIVESCFVIVTALKYKSSFKLKPLIMTFYALGDYIILYALVPSAFVFSAGHFLLLFYLKPQKPLLMLLISCTVAAIEPLIMYGIGLSKPLFTFGMFSYIWCVTLILVTLLMNKDCPLAHKKFIMAGAVSFFVSDTTLVLRKLCIQFFPPYIQSILQIIVISTYYFATIVYAICL